MIRMVCRRFGDPDVLEVEERSSEPLGPAGVRVKVTACGVNFVDALFIADRYQITAPLPFVPGSEIAGEILEVADDAGPWTPGQRVMASIGLGGFADEAVVHSSQLHAVPDDVTDTQAATLGQSYATAWFSLTRRCVPRPGEWILVLGAGGGVGLATIDVARALDLRVIAAASSPDKLDLCVRRGAHEVVNYSDDDLVARVRHLTGGGADISVDPVGGELSMAALRSLGDFGRMLVIGFAGGSIPTLPTNQILLRNRTVMGVDWGAWAMANPADNRTLLAEVMARVADSTLSPVEPTTYALEDAATALTDLQERRVAGKVALVPAHRWQPPTDL